MIKVGEDYVATYSSPLEPRYTIGQRVQIKDNGKLIVVFVVEQNEGDKVYGKIVNTYGHKRTKK